MSAVSQVPLKTFAEKTFGRVLHDHELAGVNAITALAQAYADGRPGGPPLVPLAQSLLGRKLTKDQAELHPLFAEAQRLRPTSPLELVAILGRASLAEGIRLHGWFFELEQTPTVRDIKRRFADELQIVAWRTLLTLRVAMPEYAPTSPNTAPRQIRLRQVEPGLFRWENRKNETGVWSRLDSEFLQRLRFLGPAAIAVPTHPRELDALKALFVAEEWPVLALLLKYSRGTFGYGDVNATATRHTPDNPLLELLRAPSLAHHVTDATGRPIGVSSTRLVWAFRRMASRPGYVFPRLALPSGDEAPRPLVAVAPGLYAGPTGFFPGPAPLGDYDGSQETIPEFLEKTFASPDMEKALRDAGDLPPSDPSEAPPPVRVYPKFECEYHSGEGDAPDRLCLSLVGVDDAGVPRLRCHRGDWERLPASASAIPGDPDPEPLRRHRDAFRQGPGELDLAGVKTLELSLANLDETSAWLRRLDPSLLTHLPAPAQALVRPADKAEWRAELHPVKGSEDWFDLRLVGHIEAESLTRAEVDRLLAARGSWVKLADKGWRRAAVEDSAEASAALEKLGLSPDALDGAPQRFHAWQLAGDKLDKLAAPEVVTALRRRLDRLAALPKPELPSGLAPGVTLRPYQHDGFHFLAHLAANGLGGLLADDMGLGKTLQTLTWLLWLKETRPADAASSPDDATPPPFRVLVVAPKSVVNNWVSETRKFAPGLIAALHDGVTPPEKRTAAHLVVVNYARLRLDKDLFLGEAWDAVVLDEAQHIKSPTSEVTRVAYALRSRHRLVLSGTPVENRLTDLWSLMNFAMPGLLGSLTAFKKHYDERRDPKAGSRLGERVRPFLLRRTKLVVAKDLPERSEEDLVIDMEPGQRALYDIELRATRALLLGATTTAAMNAARFGVLQSLLRLRQICCDPRLVHAEAPESDSAKLDALLELLGPTLAEGRKVLVFSQFTSALDLISARLKREKIGHLMLTGKTENRAALVERFQKPDTEKVFLLSLKAAGSGLTLTAASSVVLYDPWWNPAAEAQAIDRTHRIGQTNPVVAYRFLAKDSIEQKIRALQREKTDLAGQILEDSDTSALFDLATLRDILAG